VAAARVKLWGWWIAAVLAAGFLGFLAFHGERPEAGLVRFEPAGLLVGWSLENLEAIEVSAGAEHRLFRRVGSGRWRGEAGPLPPNTEERIATGLKLLHNSAPERVFGAGELDERTLGDFGLVPPRLTITAKTAAGRSVTIHLGGANPLGLARYARIEGRPEVVLLPAFVADAWEQTMAR
jgi:Domain of unknown function (DUF4340)